LIGALHQRFVFGRRVAVLAAHLAPRLPDDARVLDVGCGDGRIARAVMALRPGLQISGIDVLRRPAAAIPVAIFDGRSIPYGSGSFDGVVLIDVLHHTEDPSLLLREAARVSRGAIVLKDHLCELALQRATLRLMDWIGNAHHGVALPYNYWSRKQWHAAFDALRLRVQSWDEDLGLYPPWANWCFGGRLHFIACLTRSAENKG